MAIAKPLMGAAKYQSLYYQSLQAMKNPGKKPPDYYKQFYLDPGAFGVTTSPSNQTMSKYAEDVSVLLKSREEWRELLMAMEKDGSVRWCTGQNPLDNESRYSGYNGKYYIEWRRANYSDGSLRHGDSPTCSKVISFEQAMEDLGAWKPKEVKPIKLDLKAFDKVILDPLLKDEVISVLKQFESRKKLFEEWGLGEIIEYGRGMIFLFHGVPGTGKTYLARAIATACGKEVTMLGAAQLQSSTPGEYERNLIAAFSEAKSKDHVLLFDECDGLIQSRQGMGQIMSGENNCFLQEIEKFEGIVVMTTNRIDSLDEALERRLSLILEFKTPSQDERKAIWERIIPKKMPLKKDVDIEELSTHFLTGGEIKNCVLNAARFAVAKDAKDVGRDDFIKAIERVLSGRKAFSAPRSVAHLSKGGKADKVRVRG